MKRIKRVLLLALTLIIHFSVSAQDAPETSFEGVLTTRVTIGGVDMSILTGKTGSQKGDMQEQMKALSLDSEMQVLLQRNPMMGILLIMMPPKATIYLKNGIALAKIKGLGYDIEHYHNLKTDEAFIYTASADNHL